MSVTFLTNLDRDEIENKSLQKTGGTMTGPIILADNPTQDNEAATKKYVDNSISSNNVKYVEQELTDEQKAQTRENIGAVSEESIVQTPGDSETAVMSQKAVTEELSQLLEEKVDKTGIGQIAVRNIDGFGVIGNTTDRVLLLAEKRFLNYENTISLELLGYDDTTYNTYLFQVGEDENKFTFGNNSSEAVALMVGYLGEDKKTYVKAPVYTTFVGYYTIDAENVKYVVFSTKANLTVCVGEEYTTEYRYTTPEWLRGLESPMIQHAKSVGGFLKECQSGIKKNAHISFSSKLSSYNYMAIGFATGEPNENWVANFWETNYEAYFLIRPTSVTFVKMNADNQVFEHGLTISSFINIQIDTKYDGTIVFSMLSDKGSFSIEVIAPLTMRVFPFFDLNATVVEEQKMTWTCADFNKKYWFFGDSYFNPDNTRWMNHYKCKKNCLVNGYSGESSYYAYNDLANIIKYGNPRYIVWCMGMNDGGDVNGVPSWEWERELLKFIKICETYKITPILATIPTVPSVNNEAKNEWVRNSGYRYIDFAKAVGAQADGTWYNGMISPYDYVHPSELGAIALCSRVYTDFPEPWCD